MPCLCPANTLQLFIKTVAQVELPSSILRTCPKQLQRATIRHLSSSRSSRSASIPFEKSPPNAQERRPEQKSWPQGSAETGTLYASGAQAIVESAPKKSLSKVATRKMERYGPASTEPKPVVRRTKTINTGLAIHYSAPRAETPPLPTSDTKPQTKTFTPTTDGDDWTPPPREHWQLDKAALKAKFPEGWKPLKKLSPDALAGIRALHAQAPEQYTTEVLASNFKISPEAIRRILKSKWSPSSEEEMDRQKRWLNRGKSIYTRHAELGQKPPKMWRDMGIGKGKPEWMLRKQTFREKEPLPALITTSRARDAKYGVNGGGERLEDRIL